MEHASIEREIRVDATLEVVFSVISSPEHIREWWGAESDLQPVPGASGELVWGDKTASGAHVVPFTVVDADPPHLFSFRWVPPVEGVGAAGNSLLVTFELEPSGQGTLLKLTESGFREMGWEAAVLEEMYNDHVQGWDHHLHDLCGYLSRLVSAP